MPDLYLNIDTGILVYIFGNFHWNGTWTFQITPYVWYGYDNLFDEQFFTDNGISIFILECIGKEWQQNKTLRENSW